MHRSARHLMKHTTSRTSADTHRRGSFSASGFRRSDLVSRSGRCCAMRNGISRFGSLMDKTNCVEPFSGCELPVASPGHCDCFYVPRP